MKLPSRRSKERDTTFDTELPHDADTTVLVRDIRVLVAGTNPEPEFVHALEHRLRREAAARTVRAARRQRSLAYPPRQWVNGWMARSAAVAAVTLLLFVAGLGVSSQARVRASQFACLIPGLGIRDCNTPGLVATGPVSATRDGATLTVTHLLSSEGQTTVRLEITGLPFPSNWSGLSEVHVTLRDAAGKTYGRATTFGKGSMRSGGFSRSAAADGGPAFVREETLAALDPALRAVDLLVDGPAPIGSWRVRVPLLPVGEAQLASAALGTAGVAHQGITVRVAGVVNDRQGLTVQLTAELDPTTGVVRNLGGDRYGTQRPLILRDDRGRESAERPRSSAQVPPDAAGRYVDDAAFTPPAVDARTATLTVPFVTIEETGGEATLRVPLAGRASGEHIPVAGDLTIGPYRFRVTDVFLAQDNMGEPRLWLTLDLGTWTQGRKLVSPGRAAINGDASVWRGASACGGDVGQCERLAVALPRGTGDAAIITFRNPIVAVQGPWQLDVPLAGER